MAGGGQLSPFLVGPDAAAKLIGVKKTLFYQMASDGRLGPVPVEFSSKRLYLVAELQDWVQQRCPPRHQWSETLNNDQGVLAKGGK